MSEWFKESVLKAVKQVLLQGFESLSCHNFFEGFLFCIMYLSIFMLPLFGSLIAGGFGRFFGKRGSALISTFCLFVSSFFSIVSFYEVGFAGCPVNLPLFSWIRVELLDSFWCVSIDTLTSVMLVVVTCVSFFVHVYSIGYMASEPYLSRFISYLSLFTFLILSLVLADNYLQLFFG